MVGEKAPGIHYRCKAPSRDKGMDTVRYQSSWLARRAPWTIDSSLDYATRESIRRPQTDVPNPQSLPTMTFSLPTTPA